MKAKWQQIAETIAEAGRGFPRDTFLYAVIGSLALLACAFGHGGVYALGFACFFMLAIPILRYFNLIDAKDNRGRSASE
jgi:hypothetical protein